MLSLHRGFPVTWITFPMIGTVMDGMKMNQ